MKFSILVPVYNVERYLAECIQSALQQSEQDFELVLVDDGSTDRSGLICEHFAVQNPEHIHVIHQQNRGLILARRAGIAAAKGEYCVFLDGDDALEAECLTFVRETIERHNADIVIYNNYSYFEDDQTRESNEPVFTDDTVFRGEQKKLLYRELIASWRLNNLWTKAIRTTLLHADDTPYLCFAANPYGEDLLQTLYPVTHADCIVYRTRELYIYRRHSRSMTRELDPKQIARQNDVAILNQLRAYMTQWGMDKFSELNLLRAREINALLTLFWQYYRGSKSFEQKQAVLEYNWGELLDTDSEIFLKSKQLSCVRRIQMQAVLRKRRLLLDCFAVIGSLKMKWCQRTPCCHR